MKKKKKKKDRFLVTKIVRDMDLYRVLAALFLVSICSTFVVIHVVYEMVEKI